MEGGIYIGDTLGAILIGAFISAALSGVFTLQALLYYRTYTGDFRRNKSMVAILWLLDLTHAFMTCSSTWTYLVTYRNDNSVVDFIPWSIAVTVALTAFITFIVHAFLAHRVYILSARNLLLTGIIVSIAFTRLCCAMVTTSQMIRLHHFSTFIHGFSFIFTSGLVLSAAVDFIITASLLVLLRRNRTGYSTQTDHLLDSISRYSLETGLVTFVVTLVALSCWLTMPTNLIFLALHFLISKLYANTVLATLNSRKSLRRRADFNPPLPTVSFDSTEDPDKHLSRVDGDVEAYVGQAGLGRRRGPRDPYDLPSGLTSICYTTDDGWTTTQIRGAALIPTTWPSLPIRTTNLHRVSLPHLQYQQYNHQVQSVRTPSPMPSRGSLARLSITMI